MKKVAYLATIVIATMGAIFFVIFVWPSFDRLFLQENSTVATANSQLANQSAVTLAIDNITFNKTGEDTTKMQIGFSVKNPSKNTAILQTIQYGVYLDGSKIASGAVGKESDDIIRGQGDLYQVLGSSSLSVKDMQIIKKSDIDENNWNKITAAIVNQKYVVKGFYSVRGSAASQPSGTDRDFELTYPHSLTSLEDSNNNNINVTMQNKNNNLSSSRVSLKLIKAISLPNVQGRIDHMAIDLKNQRLFIAELANNSVDVVGLRSGTRIRALEGLSEPQGIDYIPSSERLVVANGGDGSVRIFDGKSFAILHNIRLGEDADNTRYDNATGLVYVGYGGGAIATINATAGLQSSNDIKLGGHPESFQVEKSGNRIFVNVPSTNSITVADKGNGQVSSNWTPSASQNFPLALDENNHRLFVGARDPAKLIVINTDNGKEVASLDTVGDADDISYDSVNHQLYVSGGEGFIDVYKQQDADHYNLLSKISTSTGARTSLFVPELKQLYLAVPQHDTKDAEIWVYSLSP